MKFVSETEAIFIYHQTLVINKKVEDTDAFHGKYIVAVLEGMQIYFVKNQMSIKKYI